MTLNLNGSWRSDIEGFDSSISGADAVALLRDRWADGVCETWFRCDHGGLVMFVTNGERAMVMLLLDGDADNGEHAVDLYADEFPASDGFVLSNGQHDSYPDRHTVPLTAGHEAVRHIIDVGAWPDSVDREID